MKLSLGNATYNHKPDKGDMVWHSGFLDAKKRPIECPVVEDTTEQYAWAYDNGLCVKGYKFTSEQDTMKRTFVCDFDNLTEEQFKRVIEKVKNCGLKRICGRMSSGMKMEAYLHKDDPSWIPTKWKYKVFFPLDEFYGGDGVLCVREEVEKAYIDVVQFFNEWSDEKKTTEVAKKWLKANNQSMFHKHGEKKGQLRANAPKMVIENPIFKDYILPDPVEVMNTRHQITYAVIPEQPEPFRYLTDDEWRKLFGRPVGRHPSSSKYNFTSVVNLAYDFRDEIKGKMCKVAEKVELDKDETEKLARRIEMMLMSCGEAKHHDIPTSRSMMAKKSRKHKWSDLVFDFNDAATLNKTIYSNWENGYEMDKVLPVVKTMVKFLVRCEAEYEMGSGTLMKKSVVDNVLGDIPYYVAMVFGKTFIADMNEKKVEAMSRCAARTMLRACELFGMWRIEQKCYKIIEQNPTISSKWAEMRSRLRETKSFKDYNANRAEFFKLLDKEAHALTIPYTYTRWGVKKEMLKKALNHTPMSKEGFVEFVVDVASAQDGVLEEERIEKWYRDYQSAFNKAHIDKSDFCAEMLDQLDNYKLGKEGKLVKQHKQHKSKFDYLFNNGKSKKEVAEEIANLDINRVQRKRLMDRLNKEYCENVP